MNSPILISNSFPFSLIRRRVVVKPRHENDLMKVMHERHWVSLWGHANTVKLASSIASFDLRPKTERPALKLTTKNLPELNGQSFMECWMLCPQYVPGFRPAIGEEVSAEQILNWQVLQLTWTPYNDAQA